MNYLNQQKYKLNNILRLSNQILHRNGTKSYANYENINQINRWKSTVSAANLDSTDNTKPLGYIGSKAERFKAKEGRSGNAGKYVWYQPYVISASLSVFLLYFCVFREENDIDRKFDGSLFDQVAGLELVQLKVSYEYNKKNGLPTGDLEKRLLELGYEVVDEK